MIVRRRAIYNGKVQGVGFRFFCLKAAEEHGVSGWVRNLPDGSVELEAQGEASTVERFLQHAASAHPWAKVNRWEAREARLQKDENEFRIKNNAI